MNLISSVEQNYSKKEILRRSRPWLDNYETTDSVYQLSSYFDKLFPNIKATGAGASDFRALCNELMLHYCHNEAYIKSTFIKKELLKGHHVTIFELPVVQSRADLCKINGHSICYEIKTDYDTLKRLKKQLLDYSLVFEYVFVICSEKRSAKILPLLPNHVGLYVYKDSSAHLSYKKMKRAMLSPFISPKKQLECLSQSELRSISKTKEKSSKIIPLLLKKGSEFVNLAFKTAIKQRYREKWESFSIHINDYHEVDYQFFYQSMFPSSIIR
jgi:hypothetical protein